MDAARFDALARSLTTSASRRSALVGIALGIATSIFADLDSEAKNRRRGKSRTSGSDQSNRVGVEKKKKKKKKGNKKKRPTAQPAQCIPNCNDGNKTCGGDGCTGTCGTCSESQVCQNGQCVSSCSAGFDFCDGSCVNTKSDLEHCGSCNDPCEGQLSCIDGVCGCAAGTQCGSQCFDTQTDVDHCGGCTPCPAVPNGTRSCEAGLCGIASCHGDFKNCNGNLTDGCETNTQSHPAHCGKCGVVCSGGQCSNRTCSQVFTNPGTTPYTAPAAGTLAVEALGAMGGAGGQGEAGSQGSGRAGGSGGRGARVLASFSVTAGQALHILVGGTGSAGFNATAPGQGGQGGFNSGDPQSSQGALGDSGSEIDGGDGGGGGGASEVRNAVTNSAIVNAGGGGGGGGGAGGPDIFSASGHGGDGGVGGVGGAGGGSGQGGNPNGQSTGGDGGAGNGSGPGAAQVSSGFNAGPGRVTIAFTPS